jgi:hypothetical protein
MAFGNLITSGTLIATGTYGKLVSFDLSSNRIRALASVQLLKSGILSPVTFPVAANSILEYTEDPSCPAVACALDGTTVYVFIKSAGSWDFDITTSIAFTYYEFPQKASVVSAALNVDPKARGLLKALMLRNLYDGDRVPFSISQAVIREKKLLGLE